jgi:hypothetical protein
MKIYIGTYEHGVDVAAAFPQAYEIVGEMARRGDVIRTETVDTTTIRECALCMMNGRQTPVVNRTASRNREPDQL